MAATPTSERSLKLTLWLVAIGIFMQTLDTTVVNTALPAMAASLGESPLRMQSVVIAYTLTMAVLIPASGWMADRFGTRIVFFSAIVLFTAGSALCASAQSLNQLVAWRVLQGAGGAMLLPVGRLAILRTFPRERLLPAMSFVAIPGLVGPLVGPTVGGWLSEWASWHWVFLINIPVGIAGGIATWLHLADSREAHPHRFDLGGYLMLAFGMAAISLALDGLSGAGMRHAPAFVLLIFGIVAVVAYWLHAHRKPDPIFPPDLFAIHTFTVGMLGSLFARIGAGAMPFLLPLLLQVSLGYSPSHAGMMMLPVAAAGMLSKRIATPLITRLGYRSVLVWNTLLVGSLMAVFALIGPTQPVGVHLLLLAVFGAVNSLQFTAMNTLCIKDLQPHNASSGNSLFSMIQMLSMSLAVTTAGAVLSAFTRVTDHGNPGDTLAAFHATFLCVGLITAASAWIFWQLSPDVTPTKRKEVEIDVA